MEYVNLGRTGLSVSRVCLGTMNFGPTVSEEDSHGVLDHALAEGVNVIDTANTYGRKPGEGVTEQIVGSWLAKGGGRRETVVLATKVYGSMGDGPNDRGLSARHVVAACEASLRRLRTDYIDLYQMHHVDRSTPWEEIWQAMDLLVSQGKVRYVGSSNFAGWHIAACNEEARRRHSLGLVSEQCIYNLLNRHAELEVIPAAEHYGLGVLPWSPLGGGALSGVLRKLADGTAERSAHSRSQHAVESDRPRLERWEALCGDLGHAPSEVALAWLLSRPGVTAPVIGPRTRAHVDGAIAATRLTLEPETLAELDVLFPPVGAGGPSPEAWAW